MGRVVSRHGRSYTYDNLNRVTSVSHNGQVISYTYDALGRQITESGPTGTITSHYNLAGRRTELIHPDGYTVSHDYDVVGTLVAVRENGPAVLASFTYDDYGRRTGINRANGVTSDYSYNQMNQLSGFSHNPAGTEYDQTVTFEYNRSSQIVKRAAANERYTRPMPQTYLGRHYMRTPRTASRIWRHHAIVLHQYPISSSRATSSTMPMATCTMMGRPSSPMIMTTDWSAPSQKAAPMARA